MIVELGTYILAKNYYSPDIVMLGVAMIAISMITLAYLVSSGVEKISRAKRMLQIEEEKIRAIINFLADGLIMLSRDENVTMINPRAEHILGISSEEALGYKARHKKTKTFSSLNRVLKNTVDIKNFKKLEPIRQEIEIDFPRKRILKIITTPVMNPSGKVLGVVKLLDDITREKEMDTMKTDFVSMASHQLKTPLAILRWNLELLQKMKSNQINFSKNKEIDIVNQSAKTNQDMIEIVNDLLNVSRIEEGRVRLDKKIVSFEKIVSEVAEKLSEKAKLKKISLEFKSSKIPEFRIDEAHIKQAVINLIENAIEYTPANGKISLKIKYPTTKDGRNTKGTQLKNKYATLEIKDSGIGIPEKEIPKLFTKFFRASNASKISVKGTGLGLFICKNIVERHKGKIWVESTLGKGSVFSISLPKEN